MKKSFLVALSLLMVAGLVAACSPAAAPTAASEPAKPAGPTFKMPDYPKPPEGTKMVDTTKWKKSPPWTIGYANASTANSFRQFTVAALYWMADQYPELVKKVVITNANDSIPKQISDMEDLVTQGVDIIIIAATSKDALVPAVDKAMAAGIPVIILERALAGENYATFIDVNTKLIATTQAQAVVDALGGKGNIVTFGIKPGIGTAVDQEAAIKAVLEKNPGIKQLAFDYGQVSLSVGKTLMETWLQTYPQIDGVLGWSGTEIRGAVEAAKEAGRYDQIKVWAAKDEMGYLQLIAGGMPGVGVLGFSDCTIDAFNAALRILSGEPVPLYWRLDPQVITKANIDKYVIKDAPFSWFPSRMSPKDIQKYLDLAAKK